MDRLSDETSRLFESISAELPSLPDRLGAGWPAVQTRLLELLDELATTTDDATRDELLAELMAMINTWYGYPPVDPGGHSFDVGGLESLGGDESPGPTPPGMLPTASAAGTAARELISRVRAAGSPDRGEAPTTRNGGDEAPTGGDEAPTGDDPAEPEPGTYAHLDCPSAVVSGEEFDLEVGLSGVPDPDVVTDTPLRLPSTATPYFLTVQIDAHGFTLRHGESSTVTLAVTPDQPYPVAVRHLIASATGEPIKPRLIRATYAIDGQVVGIAYRPISVLSAEQHRADLPPRPESRAIDVSPPTGEEPADLTVFVSEREENGRLGWSFFSSVTGIAVPDEVVERRIGKHPEAFLNELIGGVDHSKPSLLRKTLLGNARLVAAQLPPEFWDLLRAIAAHVAPRPPTVLIVSEEPFVPWELALVEPPLDPDRPPFLGAQAIVGRWTADPKLRKPMMPPPEQVRVKTLAAVTGVYGKDPDWTWDRLPHAEREAADLGARYRARQVEVRSAKVNALLDGSPKADVMHFACHARYAPGDQTNGLVLIDRGILPAATVIGAELLARPLVFLNACQAGGGYDVLGSCGGLVHGFLVAGAAAVVAPLWSVDDKAGREIALRFYARTIEGKMRPAEALWAERGAFKMRGRTRDATELAYQFFGHPSLRLRRDGD